MTPNKLKDLFSRINIDDAMDQRIKNHLLHKEDRYYEGDIRETQYRHKGHRVSLIRVLASVVLSVSALVLVVAMLYGLKSVIVHFNDSWRNSVSSEGPGDLTEDQGDESSTDDGIPASEKPESEDDKIDDQPDKKDDEPESADSGDTSGTGDEDKGDGNATEDSSEMESGSENNDSIVNDEKKPGEEPGTQNNQGTLPVENTTPKSSTATLDSVFFDTIADGSKKVSIPSLIIRFYGVVESINPADLTDVVLTRDGVPVDNKVIYTGRFKSGKWQNKAVTDFYFEFEHNNVEPGVYDLTGKYQGKSFDVYEKIIEAEITDEPANPDDLWYVSWSYSTDANDNAKSLSELVFGFWGRQNKFYITDISELKVCLNGEEIPIDLSNRIFRYCESQGTGSEYTMFNIILNKKLESSGLYKVTGKYRGKDFVSMDIEIP